MSEKMHDPLRRQKDSPIREKTYSPQQQQEYNVYTGREF